MCMYVRIYLNIEVVSRVYLKLCHLDTQIANGLHSSLIFLMCVAVTLSQIHDGW